jgi:murein DD-endopeptidase MepM/ murein hydrolase activator NlpD
MKGFNLSLNDFVANVRRQLATFISSQESNSLERDDAAHLASTGVANTGQQAEHANGILTHERGTAQVIMPAAPKSKHSLPVKHLIRGGVATAVLVSAGWLLWSRGMADAKTLPQGAELASRAAAAEPGTILGLRPTFTPTPLAATRLGGESAPAVVVDSSELAQIVIVTPTPDPRRSLTVAGAIIDRPLAVAGAERTSVGLAGLLPIGAVALAAEPPAAQLMVDLSTLKIPPMIEEVTGAPVPQVEIIPIGGIAAEPVEEVAPVLAAPEPVAPLLPSAVNNGPTRAWSSFQPKPPEENDHFWVASAFLNTEYNSVAAPSYQFGSTAGGQYRPHHGIDIANRWGTPVQAGTAGVVVFAGLDDPIAMGPYPNFYGNTVVIKLERKLPVASGELDAFVLYGHLSRVTVTQGQQVAPGDIVGEVGMTGIAIGPHLHVEMRVGENTYENSVNSYLWLKPAPGDGAVAVRLVTADGRSWPGARLTLARFEDGRAVWGRLIETYLDNENIGPNPSWGENGAMGDVPAGYYVLIGNVNGEAVRAEFFVREGQTTFVEIRTKQ